MSPDQMSQLISDLSFSHHFMTSSVWSLCSNFNLHPLSVSSSLFLSNLTGVHRCTVGVQECVSVCATKFELYPLRKRKPWLQTKMFPFESTFRRFPYVVSITKPLKVEMTKEQKAREKLSRHYSYFVSIIQLTSGFIALFSFNYGLLISINCAVLELIPSQNSVPRQEAKKTLLKNNKQKTFKNALFTPGNFGLTFILCFHSIIRWMDYFHCVLSLELQRQF